MVRDAYRARVSGSVGARLALVRSRPRAGDRGYPADDLARLESPFRYHLRHVTRTSELCGVTIPANATVLLLWGAANRDPAEYDRPDEVVLDRRAARHHLGFGRGIHHCVGAPLARLEAHVILTPLLQRTAHFALDPDAAAVCVDSLMVRRFSSLPLIATTSGDR